MAKRGNGEGSISRRKDGTYMARYYVDTPAGRKRRTIYGKKGEKRQEVADRLAEALGNRSKGLVFDAENQKLGEYLDRWLADSVRGSVKAVTFESYSRLVRVHIVPALGRVKLKAISPAHLQGFYRTKLDAGLSPRTVQYIHSVLHRALKQALRWGLVARNVSEAVDPPRVRREEICWSARGCPEAPAFTICATRAPRCCCPRASTRRSSRSCSVIRASASRSTRTPTCCPGWATVRLTRWRTP